MKRFPLMASVMLLLCCQNHPHISVYATNEPDRELLVGQWKLTPEMVEVLSHGAYRNIHPSLTLAEDGSLDIREIPNLWRGMDSDGRVEDVGGTWKLEKTQNQCWGITIKEAQVLCYGCIDIINNKPPYKLVIRYGDPDAGQGFEFEKVANSADKGNVP